MVYSVSGVVWGWFAVIRWSRHWHHFHTFGMAPLGFELATSHSRSGHSIIYIMARNLGQKIGLYHLDLQHILGYEDNNNIPGYQETVKSELAEYIRATGRFISSPQAPSSP